MPQISSQIVITKTVPAVFGNEKDAMCLVFIKNQVFVWCFFPFFFSSLLGYVVSFWSMLCQSYLIFFFSRFNFMLRIRTHKKAPECCN